MTEHLPECILPTYLDAVLWRRAPQGLRVPCICDELRSCEQRVMDSAVQRVIELPDLIDAGFAYYMNLLNRAAVIDAIRGEP